MLARHIQDVRPPDGHQIFIVFSDAYESRSSTTAKKLDAGVG
jgi:hypothetical protein